MLFCENEKMFELKNVKCMKVVKMKMCKTSNVRKQKSVNQNRRLNIDL